MARNLQLLAERLAAKNRRIDASLEQSPAPYESPFGNDHTFGIYTPEDRACARIIPDPPRVTPRANSLDEHLARAIAGTR